MQKVLIITYYWPPAGGPGVQRWLKFVKYFKDFGIEPIVYVPENPTYPITDSSLESEIPEGIKIIKRSIIEPYRFAGFLSKKKTKRISSGIITTKKQSFLEKTMLWVRGNLFIPDARKYWVKPSVNFLSEYIKKAGISTIVTSGPPHSLHLIGMQLKELTGVKWLADFRDPWTTIGYHSQLKLTRSSFRKHMVLEKKVLNAADIITTTSFTTQRDFLTMTTKPVEIVTNGFDTAISTEKILHKKFTLAHIGSLLSGRNPEVLWKVLQDLIIENKSFKNDLEIILAGKVSNEIISTLESYGLSQWLKLTGYLSHEQAIELQQRSQILLLIEINSDETKAIIPGKLFEYMAANRPILAIGPEQWDTSHIIDETKTGFTFLYEDYNGLKQQLLSWYSLYKRQELFIYPEGLENYTRIALTKKMAALLAKME